MPGIEQFQNEILNEVKNKIGENNPFSSDEWNTYVEKLNKIEDVDDLFPWKDEVLFEWKMKLIKQKIYQGYGHSAFMRLLNEEISRKSEHYEVEEAMNEWGYESMDKKLNRLNIRGSDYWEKWIMNCDEMGEWGYYGGNKKERRERRAEFIEKCLNEKEFQKSEEEWARETLKKARNYYEILEISIEHPSLDNPFPGQAIEFETTRKILRKLNLDFHPDKGGYKNFNKELKKEIFAKIQEVSGCLNDLHNKQKYDLYLYQRAENETTNQLYTPNKKEEEEFEELKGLVPNEELIRKFVNLLHNELKKEGVTWEELNEYYKRIHGEDLKDFEQEIRKYSVGKSLQALRSFVGSRLGIIEEALWEEKKFRSIGVWEDVRKRMDDKKYLGNEPLLNEEELDNHQEENFYEQVLKETRTKFFELTTGFHRKKPYETVSDLELITEKLKRRILDKRRRKRELIKKLEEYLEKSTEITEFEEGKKYREDFKNYLDSIITNTNYETRTIGKAVQEDNKEKIEGLIFRLENLEKEEETIENTEETLLSRTPINETEKKEFIEYLDKILCEIVRPGTIRTPSNLKKIKSDLSLEYDYKSELESVNFKEEAESVRIQAFKNIEEKIATQGGSDTDLREKIKKINVNFIGKLKQEIEREGKVDWSDLPDKTRNSLMKGWGEKLFSSGFAKEATKRKRDILKNLGKSDESNNNEENDDLMSKKNSLISLIRTYWKNNQVEKNEDGEINGKKKEQVIGNDWEEMIKVKTDEKEIEKIWKGWKKLIDEEKNKENSERERLIKEQEMAEAAERERQEKLEQERETNYDNLLIEIKNVATVEAVDNLTERVSSFNYDGLSSGKNFNTLQKIQNQRKAEIWREAAVKVVEDYWIDNQDDRQKVNEKVITEVLKKNWENIFLAEESEEKINEKRDELIFLIKNAKDTEKKREGAAVVLQSALRSRREKFKNVVIDEIISYWNTQKRKDNTINGKNQIQILGGNWKKNFSSFNTLKKISEEKSRLISLIDSRKDIEKLVIEEAINSVNNYWNDNTDTAGKINGESKEKILGNEWKKFFWEEVLITELTTEKEKLIEKINNAKSEEKIKREKKEKIENCRKQAIRNINDYWTEKVGEKNEKINDKNKNNVLGSDWENEIKDLKDEIEISQKSSELKVLINEEIEDWRKKAINEVKKYWKDKQDNKKINWRVREYFFTKKWKENFGEKKSEINAEKERLIRLMNENKRVEKIKLETIEKIENIWGSKSDENNKINGKFLNKVLGERWKEDIQNETDETRIENWEHKFINEIKNTETKKPDNLRNKSGKEKYLGEHLKLILNKERTHASSNKTLLHPLRAGSFEEDVEKWFEELISFFNDNIRGEEKDEFLKEISGESFVPAHLIKEKLAKEKINIIGIGKKEEKLKEDLSNNYFFKKIGREKEDKIIIKYLQEIAKIIKEQAEIKAEKTLKNLLGRKITDKHDEIKAFLINLQRLIPKNNDIFNEFAEANDSDGNDIKLDKFQIDTYLKNKNNVDKKELELIRVLSLFEDDEGKVWDKVNPCPLTDNQKKRIGKAIKSDIKEIKEDIRKDRLKKWNYAKRKVHNDFQNLLNSMAGVDWEKINSDVNILKSIFSNEEKSVLAEIEKSSKNWETKAQSRINKLKEVNDKYEWIKEGINREMDLSSLVLEEGGYWYDQIQILDKEKDKFPANKRPLFTLRDNLLKPKYEKLSEFLREYNGLIEKLDKEDDWERWKTLHAEIVILKSQSASNNLNNFSLNNAKKLVEKEAEKIIQIIESWTDIDDRLTQRINKLESDLESYELELPANKRIKEIKNLLNKQKEKINFRTRFRKRLGENNYVANDIIDPYLKKGLTPEKMADAYSYHNLYQRVSAAEIDASGKVFFAKRIYNLHEEEGLTNLQRDKLFVYDFRIHGNFSEQFVTENILVYRKSSPNQKYWVTGQQASNAYRHGWTDPTQIQINNEAQKQINLGTGWKNYDWGKFSFEGAKEKELKNLKINDEELSAYFEEVKNGTIDEKFSALSKIEENFGEEILENKKSEERKIRISLATDRPKEYKENVVKRIEKTIREWKISEDREWKISEDDIKDIKLEEVVEIEENFIERIWRKGSEKEMEKIIEENKYSEEELEKKTLEFKNSTNIYKKAAYEKNKTKIEQLLRELKNSSVQTNDYQKRNSSFRKEVIIPVIIIGMLVSVLAVVIRRNNSKIKPKI
ncbi:MAG: hypothetical protein MRERC_5c067 [Mycoplasmataceae bacterium RC_NB112A]|nr:MAG: hypothetical protein MRERC_5c067 [Mycoplasmataceae bacterium RC_NB112A]